MSSISESGHVKNLAHFKNIINFCQGYGATYNPSTESIKLPNLLLLLKAGEDAHADCIKKQTLFDNASDTRRMNFAGLIPKATRVVNALIASGAEENTIKSARSVMNKLLGKRSGKLNDNPDPGQPIPENISVSQRSIDKQLEHLAALLEIIQSIPSYQPNESELQTASLLAYQTQLVEANQAVMQTYTDWSNSCIVRYNTMYVPKIGFSATSRLIKTYVKSVYGASSQQFKQLSAYQFTKPAK